MLCQLYVFSLWIVLVPRKCEVAVGEDDEWSLSSFFYLIESGSTI